MFCILLCTSVILYLWIDAEYYCVCLCVKSLPLETAAFLSYWKPFARRVGFQRKRQPMIKTKNSFLCKIKLWSGNCNKDTKIRTFKVNDKNSLIHTTWNYQYYVILTLITWVWYAFYFIFHYLKPPDVFNDAVAKPSLLYIRRFYFA